MSEVFYFDEFFASDEGVEVLVPVRGRQVPMTIKRSLTLKDRVAAQAKAIKRRVDPNTGQIIIESVDEAAGMEEILLAMLIKWPFVTRDGSPVPINRENINKFVGFEPLTRIIKRMEEEGEEALVPFADQSVTDYETNQLPTSTSPQEAPPSA